MSNTQLQWAINERLYDQATEILEASSSDWVTAIVPPGERLAGSCMCIYVRTYVTVVTSAAAAAAKKLACVFTYVRT